MPFAAADFARDLNVAVQRARVMMPARHVARFRDDACNWLAGASVSSPSFSSAGTTTPDHGFLKRVPPALVGFSNAQVAVKVPRLLLGRQAGLSTINFAHRTDDLGWGSTRVVEGPHLDLLQRAVVNGGSLSDTQIKATRYWSLCMACVSLAGQFHGAHTESELLRHARDFIAWGLDTPAADVSAPVRLARKAPIVVAPIVDSDCYSIVDGHHQAAVAAFQGAQEITARSLRLATRTPLQVHLSRMSWLNGERHRLYQPIQSPELGRSWVTVRRCDDRLTKMMSFIERLGELPAEPSYVDLACCYGWFVAKMAEAGFRSTGVERDASAGPLGMHAYGLHRDQMVTGDAWDWLRSESPRSTTLVSCFSLIQHILMAGGQTQLRVFVQLLDRVTDRVLFIDSGEDHERMYARYLSNWNAQTIEAFLRANTSFDDVINLGPDEDGTGLYKDNYGRHLFACVRWT